MRRERDTEGLRTAETYDQIDEANRVKSDEDETLVREMCYQFAHISFLMSALNI